MKKPIWLILVLVFLIGVAGLINGQASGGKNKPLTNDGVVSLVKAGLGDSAIVALIKSSPTDFDKSAEALIELKTAGVSNAIIEAMASAGTMETPAVTKKEDLPSSYGIYALSQNGAQELQSSPVSTVIGLKPGGLRSNTDRGMAMDGFSGEPQNIIADPSRGFVIYQQNVKPGDLSLSELAYVRSARASDFNILKTSLNFREVYLANPSDNIQVGLWRPNGKVAFRVEPVEGRSGMFKLLPVKELKPGKYALFSGKELHNYDVVFTADTNRQATAIFFSIVPSTTRTGSNSTENSRNTESTAANIQEPVKVRQGVVTEDEKKKTKEYLKKVAKEEGAQVSPSGIIYIEKKAGDGASPKATNRVTVHYDGTFINGENFDSSRKRGAPNTFPLNSVIPCWTEGIQKMRVGGQAKLVCPPETAYGDQGAGGVIPGGATLVFDIELLRVGNPIMVMAEAADYCTANGGRLSTLKELRKIYKTECTGGQHLDSCDQTYISSDEHDADHVWGINFRDGEKSDMPNNNVAAAYFDFRCVQ